MNVVSGKWVKLRISLKLEAETGIEWCGMLGGENSNPFRNSCQESSLDAFPRTIQLANIIVDNNVGVFDSIGYP